MASHCPMRGWPGSKVCRAFSCGLEKPLNFDAVDRQPVDLVFALLAPENAGVEHLKALALGVTHTARCIYLRQTARKS